MSALDTLLYGYRTLLAATSAVSQRSKLNFSSAFTVADNAATESTDVGLSGTLTATLATVTAMVLSVLRLTSENNALAGSQNDVTIGSNTIVRVTDAGAVTWTGIAADSGRRVLLVHAVGAGGLTLVHGSASSVAANRFAFPGSANIALVTNQIAILVYDTTQARWLYVGSLGGGSGFTPPTGTGLVTVTGGVLDGASTALGTGVSTFLTTPSSANLRTALTDETGTGVAVFSITPTLTGLDLDQVTEAGAGPFNNYAIGTTSVIYCTGNPTFNGFAAPASGKSRILIIVCPVGSNVTLNDENAGSTAANRIRLDGNAPAAAATNYTLMYVQTLARWKLIAYPQF